MGKRKSVLYDSDGFDKWCIDSGVREKLHLGKKVSFADLRKCWDFVHAKELNAKVIQGMAKENIVQKYQEIQ